MSLVQLSVSGSMLIAVVLILQKLLLYRLPKWFFDLLWKAAALHLLLPLSLSCRWSIWNVSSAFTSQLPAPMPENTVESWMPVYTPPQEINTSATASIPILQLVWIGGMLLILCAALLCHLRHRLCLRRHNLPVSSAKYAVSPRYRIYRNSLVRAPVSYGLLRPVIILPDTTYDSKTLETILAHETYHIQRGDLWAKYLFLIALSVHWFNPFAWLMYFYANHAMELACDETVLRRAFGDSRSLYARTLLTLAENRTPKIPLVGEFGYHTGKERICAIMKYQRTGIAAGIVCILLATGIITVFATSPAKITPENPPVSVSGLSSALLSTSDGASSSEAESETDFTSEHFISSSDTASISGESKHPSASAPAGSSFPSTKSPNTEASPAPVQPQNTSSAAEVPSASPTTQPEGELRLAWPLPVIEGTTQVITQPFSAFGQTPHHGVDMTVTKDSISVRTQPVVASFNGVVESVAQDELHGNVIRIRYSDRVFMEYHHVDHLCVSSGQVISAGSQICTVGCTGRGSTGIHVHVSLNIDGEWVDPFLYWNRQTP